MSRSLPANNPGAAFAPDASVRQGALRHRRWLPLLAFLLSVMGVLLIGISVYQTQREQTRRQTEVQLASLGEQRVEQMVDWLDGLRRR
jgi:CHASE1-domain containing sensor protein